MLIAIRYCCKVAAALGCFRVGLNWQSCFGLLSIIIECLSAALSNPLRSSIGFVNCSGFFKFIGYC